MVLAMAKPAAKQNKAKQGNAKRTKAKRGKTKRTDAKGIDAAPARKPPSRAQKNGEIKTIGGRPPPRSDDAHAFIPDPSEGGKPPSDDLAELLGEDYLQAATSGNEALEDDLDSTLPEEIGGPFVPTTSREELAHDIDDSNPRDAKREPFPRTSAALAQRSPEELRGRALDEDDEDEEDEL
jgi:hypothetical protein